VIKKYQPDEFDLERKYGETLKINFKIFNRNSFLFNIFVADIEIFSKHYNKTSFG